jgi:hypothetical protein
MQGNGQGAALAGIEERDASLPPTLDLELDPPIEWQGKTYSTLHLEEPTTRQQRQSEQELQPPVTMLSLRNHQIALVSQVAGVPRNVIEMMRISQMLEAYNFLAPFSASGPRITES